MKEIKTGTKYDFADLKEGAWYLSYVETATSLGIIKGSESNGKLYLNGSSFISRQFFACNADY